jgi:hypothetical protein
MTVQRTNLNRSGISLTEILIGIMILGIGVISLATLFPIGLLRMRRAVNETRSTIEARSAWSEVRVRNLFAPPLGAWFANSNQNPQSPIPTYTPLSADIGGLHAAFATAASDRPFRPVTGPGIPVAIDPLWVINYRDQDDSQLMPPIVYRLGVVDLDSNGTLDFIGGEGLFRAFGGFRYNATNGTMLPSRAGFLSLASEIFSSPDDVTFGETESQRSIPYQAPFQTTGAPYLTPTYGAPFYDSTGLSLSRERRYTWLAIVRKSNAGQVFSSGNNGTLGTAAGLADADDLLDNAGTDPGMDGVLGPATSPFSYDDPTYDDPARDMTTGAPVPAPVGPFDVTIVVFYNRDLTARELTYTNYLNLSQPQPITTRPVPIFSPVARTITVGGVTYGPFQPDEATLVKRADGIPFPEIVTGGYILDATFDGSTQFGVGPRGGNVYRVERKSLNTDGNILVLSLDRAARANGPLVPPTYDAASGYVLTYLKSAVAVYEKQVP